MIIQNAVQNGLPLSVPLTSRMFFGHYSSAHIRYVNAIPSSILTFEKKAFKVS